MSWEAVNWAFNLKLPEGEKFTLIVLCNYIDQDGKAYPSIKRIAEKVGTSEKTIQRRLNNLESKGFISRYRPKMADGKMSRYQYEINQATICPVDKMTSGQSVLKPAVKLSTPKTKDINPNTPPIVPPKPKSKTKGTRLPEDWTPSPEDVEYAQSKGLTFAEITYETTCYVRYFTGPDAKNPCRKDWSRTWKNWIDRTCRSSFGGPSLSRGHAQTGGIIETVRRNSEARGEAYVSPGSAFIQDDEDWSFGLDGGREPEAEGRENIVSLFDASNGRAN